MAQKLTETKAEIFKALLSYHNMMVQTQFVIAGLYLTAASFLASSWFSGAASRGPRFLIPVLAIVFTTVCILLQLRTEDLLYAVGNRALSIEQSALSKEGPKAGFFSLMQDQRTKSIAGYRAALGILYWAGIVFWACVLGLAIAPLVRYWTMR